MTQRIFDTDNEKDKADLWDILPETINNIHKYGNNGIWDDLAKRGYLIININWHEKATLSRPIKEATEADVGKLCKFWSDDGDSTYGILSDFIMTDCVDIKYGNVQGRRWPHARRITQEELRELI